MTDHPDLTDPKTFKSWSKETVRYGDLDPVGHANNASYASYLETARVDLIKQLDGFYENNQDTALVQLNISFIKELPIGAKLDVGISIGKIGNSSVELYSSIFCDGVCHASSYAVTTMFDKKKRKSIPVPQTLRDQLSKFQA